MNRWKIAFVDHVADYDKLGSEISAQFSIGLMQVGERRVTNSIFL